MNIRVGQASFEELFVLFFILSLLSIPVVSLIVWMIVSANTRRNAKKKAKKKIQDDAAKGITASVTLPHTVGLPITDGISCAIYSYFDKIYFLASGMEFNLEKVRIMDICLKTDVEIQTQYVSNAGGAVGGAILFGALGAMIGGQPQQMTTRSVTFYLIFTFLNNNQVQYISFNAMSDLQNARRFVDEFQSTPRQNAVFNL